MDQRIQLLGVPLDAITRRDAVARIREFLAGSDQHHIVTPNNEMLVAAVADPAFHALLQTTGLNLPDSSGLLLMARWTGQRLPERVTGVDTVEALCRELTPEESVFLLGAAPGVAEKAAEVLRSRNPSLVICGTYSGSPKSEDVEAIITRIRDAKPKLLLVAFGAPVQDLWIDTHIEQMPSVRVAMGVGGTFDFLAGVQKRASAFFRNIGCEWLWRFIQEPSRYKRMWNAVVVFPWLVLRYGRNTP